MSKDKKHGKIADEKDSHVKQVNKPAKKFRIPDEDPEAQAVEREKYRMGISLCGLPVDEVELEKKLKQKGQ